MHASAQKLAEQTGAAQPAQPLSFQLSAAARARQADWPTDLAPLLAQIEADMQARMQGTLPGGVLPPMAQACLHSGGKRMRARLALEACRALGVELQAALSWAVACELMHNATLVHDDLQDGDTTRRGQPTVWVTYGAAQAINVGDWLFMLAFAALDGLPETLAQRRGFALSQAMARGMAQVIEGQGLECASGTFLQDVAKFPYEAMVRGKTAALFSLPVLGAALLADVPVADAQAFAAPFAQLGILFQMQDDVLDLYGDKGRGMVGADLYEGKISAVVVAHLEAQPQDAAWLVPLLRTPRAEVEANDVLRAIAVFRAAGTLRRVLDAMARRTEDAAATTASMLQPVMAALLARTWAPIEALRATCP